MLSYKATHHQTLTYAEPNWHVLTFLHPIVTSRVIYGAQLEMLLEQLELLIKTTWTNQYDGPIRNTEQQSGHIYYTLFLQVYSIAGPLTSHSKLCNYAQPKPFY
jgi:hypothetical protein